jgi:uncharacterized protein with ACT and thioredoxin-like domain
MVWGGGANVKGVARGTIPIDPHQIRFRVHHFWPMFLF